MNTIVVEELEKLDRAEIDIVDIRSEEEFVLFLFSLMALRS